MISIPLILLSVAIATLAITLFQTVLRKGRRAALFSALLAANLGLAIWALGEQSNNLLLYASLAAFCVLVVAPAVLTAWMRRALRRADWNRALWLTSIKALLQPGAGHERDRETLRGLVTMEDVGLDQAMSQRQQQLRQQDQQLDPAVRLAVVEQLMVFHLLKRQWGEAQQLHEQEGGIGLASASPVICSYMVRVFAELDRPADVCAYQGILEHGSAASDPEVIPLVNQARLVFLSHMGEVEELERLHDSETGFPPGMSAEGRAIWLGVALARRGDLARARELWQSVGDRSDLPQEAAGAAARLEHPPAPLAHHDGDQEQRALVQRVVANVRAYGTVPRMRRGAGALLRTPVTYVLMVLLLLIHLWVEAAGGSTDGVTLQRFGANLVVATLHGEPWRLITSMFLHAGWLHLGINCYALYMLGRFGEQLFGSGRLWTIYLVAGVAGSVASALFGDAARLSVGASGAIFGLLGAVLVGMNRMRGHVPEHWRKQVTYNLLIILGLNLFIGFKMEQVDNSAHMGGLVGGTLATLLLWLLPRGAAAAATPARRVAMAAAVMLALVTVASGVAMALTETSTTLARLPREKLRRGGIEVVVPAHWSKRDKQAMVLQDPVLNIGPTLQFEVVSAGRGDLDLLAYAKKRSQELAAELAGLGDVTSARLAERPLPGMAGPGVVQFDIDIRSGDTGAYQVNLFRSQGELIVLGLVRLPTTALESYGEVVLQIGATMSYVGSKKK